MWMRYGETWSSQKGGRRGRVQTFPSRHLIVDAASRVVVMQVLGKGGEDVLDCR